MTQWNNIVDGELGSSAFGKINNVGNDDEIAIRVVSTITSASAQINYFDTNTVVYALDTRLMYKYDGANWIAEPSVASTPSALKVYLNTTFS
jgi:hypothetical protein